MKIPNIPRAPDSAGAEFRRAAGQNTPAQVFNREMQPYQGLGQLGAQFGQMSQQRVQEVERVSIARAESDLSVALTDALAPLDQMIANGEQVTPEALDAALGSVDEVIGNAAAPAAWVEAARASAAKVRSKVAADYALKNIELEKQETAFNFSDTFETLMQRGDYDSARTVLGAMKDSGLYTATQISAAQDTVTFNAEMQRVFDAMGDVPTEDSLAAARTVADGFAARAGKNLSPEMAASLTAGANARINAFEARFDRAAREEALRASAQRDEELAQMKALATVGLPQEGGTRAYLGVADFDVMLADGDITYEEYVPLATAASARVTRESKATQVLLSTQEKITRGEPVVLSSEEQTVLDDTAFPMVFTKPVEDFSNWPVGEQAALTQWLTNGIMPTAVDDLMTAGLSPNSPSTTRSAAELSRIMYEEAPLLWGKMGQDERDFYAGVTAAMNKGVSLETATQEYRELLAMPTQERERRVRVLDMELKGQEGYEKQLRNALDDMGLPDDKGTLTPMLSMFIPEMQRSYALNGGDAEAAANTAMRRVLTNYGPSKITPGGQERMTLHPPELQAGETQYAPPELIADDLAKTLTQLSNGNGGQIDGYAPDRYDYVPYVTGDSVKRLLSDTGQMYDTYTYHIHIVAKPGVQAPIDPVLRMDDDTPVEWAPDFPYAGQTLDIELKKGHTQGSEAYDRETRIQNRESDQAILKMGPM